MSFNHLTTLAEAQQQEHTIGSGDKPAQTIVHPCGPMHDNSSLVRHLVSYGHPDDPMIITAIGTAGDGERIGDAVVIDMSFKVALTEPITAYRLGITIVNAYGEIVDDTAVVSVVGDMDDAFEFDYQLIAGSEHRNVDASRLDLFIAFLGFTKCRTMQGRVISFSDDARINTMRWALGLPFD